MKCTPMTCIKQLGEITEGLIDDDRITKYKSSSHMLPRKISEDKKLSQNEM